MLGLATLSACVAFATQECGLQTSGTWEPHLLNENLHFKGHQVLCELDEGEAGSRFLLCRQVRQGTCVQVQGQLFRSWCH